MDLPDAGARTFEHAPCPAGRDARRAGPGCGASQGPAASRASEPTAAAACGPQGRLTRAPLPQEPGVYRAGPLLLVTGQDLAQLPARQLEKPAGSEAIVVVSSDRPAVLSVDRASRARFSLQFTALYPGHPSAVISDGRAAVRFPACRKHVYRFGGRILFNGEGCARLHVSQAGRAPNLLLIPIGRTLRGCPATSAARRLPSSALPFLGVSCQEPNSIACDRVGIGVHLNVQALLVTVHVAGRLETLSPPTDPPDDLWRGYLYNAGLTRGALNVHLPRGHSLWFGTPGVHPRLRVTAFVANGTVATLAGTDFLHAGFG